MKSSFYFASCLSQQNLTSRLTQDRISVKYTLYLAYRLQLIWFSTFLLNCIFNEARYVQVHYTNLLQSKTFVVQA